MILLLSLTVLLFTPWLAQKILSRSIPDSELYSRLGWLFIFFFLFDQFEATFIAPFFVMFLLAGTVDLWYVLVFRAYVSTSSIEALFLTNSSESSEFLKAYFSWKNALIVFTYVGMSAFLLYEASLTKAWLSELYWRVVFGILVVFIVYKMTFPKKFKSVMPGLLGMLPMYLKDKRRTEKLISQRLGLVNTLDDSEVGFLTSAAPITQIVVIGESASRKHQQLYGYLRETTPHQIGFQEELVIFDNMISNFAQTNPSLSYFLTFAEQEGSVSPGEALSFIDIANKAGFETWWISNQESSKSTPNAIAKCAHHHYFLKTEALLERFDEALLPKVSEAVNSKHPYKLIIVHLVGSHFQYKERYPESFSYFKTAENIQAYSPKISDKTIEIINEYDNSIRYTDFVLSKIRGLLAQSGQASLMTYLSDHGEEVFDTRNFKGHEPSNFTKPMFEVPFWVWCSPAYQQRYPEKIALLADNRHKPLVLEDMFHFVIDALDIETSYLRHDRSWWRDEFKTRPRKVYGKYFDNWQS